MKRMAFSMNSLPHLKFWLEFITRAQHTPDFVIFAVRRVPGGCIAN